MEVEIGRGKKARRAYGFDDIAIVPSRRTRDPDDVDISWTLGPYRFELPLLAAALLVQSSCAADPDRPVVVIEQLRCDFGRFPSRQCRKSRYCHGEPRVIRLANS